MDAFLPRELSWMRLLSLRGKSQRLEGLLPESNYLLFKIYQGRGSYHHGSPRCAGEFNRDEPRKR